MGPARVLLPDLRASDGWVHIIDSPLFGGAPLAGGEGTAPGAEAAVALTLALTSVEDKAAPASEALLPEASSVVPSPAPEEEPLGLSFAHHVPPAVEAAAPLRRGAARPSSPPPPRRPAAPAPTTPAPVGPALLFLPAPPSPTGALVAQVFCTCFSRCALCDPHSDQRRCRCRSSAGMQACNPPAVRPTYSPRWRTLQAKPPAPQPQTPAPAPPTACRATLIPGARVAWETMTAAPSAMFRRLLTVPQPPPPPPTPGLPGGGVSPRRPGGVAEQQGAAAAGEAAGAGGGGGRAGRWAVVRGHVAGACQECGGSCSWKTQDGCAVPAGTGNGSSGTRCIHPYQTLCACAGAACRDGALVVEGGRVSLWLAAAVICLSFYCSSDVTTVVLRGLHNNGGKAKSDCEIMRNTKGSANEAEA